MGTRSLTKFYEDDKAFQERKAFVTIYRQMDGYPTGQGADIKSALGYRTLVNGYSDAALQTNGIHDAAALLIAHTKTPGQAGSVYVHGGGASGMWEDYVYHIWPEDERLYLTVQDWEARELYMGPLDDFDPVRCEEEEAEEIVPPGRGMATP